VANLPFPLVATCSQLVGRTISHYRGAAGVLRDRLFAVVIDCGKGGAGRRDLHVSGGARLGGSGVGVSLCARGVRMLPGGRVVPLLSHRALGPSVRDLYGLRRDVRRNGRGVSSRLGHLCARGNLGAWIGCHLRRQIADRPLGRQAHRGLPSLVPQAAKVLER
jgi:hypothetical protein